MIGDSLDSFGDAVTYSVALFAIYKLNGKKEDKTIWLGVIQICLASIILEEVIRRSFLDNDGENINFGVMIGMTCASLIGNITCSTVLYFSRKKDTDMNVKASFIFSAIDVYENAFTLIAAIVIYYTKSNIPDLIGGCIFFTVISTSSIILFRKHYLSTKKRTTM
jgi:Co/Zn/Cd efflux system component